MHTLSLGDAPGLETYMSGESSAHASYCKSCDWVRLSRAGVWAQRRGPSTESQARQTKMEEVPAEDQEEAIDSGGKARENDVLQATQRRHVEQEDVPTTGRT